MDELDVLMRIEDNTASLESQLNSIQDDTDNIKAFTLELISGDSATRQVIIDNNYKTTIYLGCINLILMVTLILTLLPARKGVLKKNE